MARSTDGSDPLGEQGSSHPEIAEDCPELARPERILKRRPAEGRKTLDDVTEILRHRQATRLTQLEREGDLAMDGGWSLCDGQRDWGP